MSERTAKGKKSQVLPGGVVAVIQARMGSTRLPGKVLKSVADRPLLGYLLERVRLSRVDDLIVATTENAEDDAVAAFCAQEGVTVYRGSEQDVLDRFYQAVRPTTCQYVMRLTGDNPLLDPGVCDRVLSEMASSSCDFVGLGPSFAEGLDCCVFRRTVLEEAWKEASLPSEREHVTLFIHNHPERYDIRRLKNDSDDSAIRITVDESRDFEVVQKIITELYSDGSIPTFQEIKAFLSETGLHALNGEIPRNEGLTKSLRAEADTAGSGKDSR